MRILFIGDVVGRSGRDALAKHLPDLKARLETDVIIVNGENAAHGIGITENICKDFYALGVDCITTGNHVWDQREIIPYIDRDPKLLRPVNFPQATPGRGLYDFRIPGGQRIIVVNAMGRLFMDPLDDPFAALNKICGEYLLGKTVQAVFVDFHAEATSEKMALANYLDGKISALVGTHTHVPTADYRVLPNGTAFQSDAGMTGDFDSVIGVKKEISVTRFVRRMPGERMITAEGEGTVCGTFIVTDDTTGRARSIHPIRVGPILQEALPA